MTVFDAESLIRDFWRSPPRMPLAYACRLRRLLDSIRADLSEAALWTLVQRFGKRKTRYGNAEHPLSVLRGIVDRSRELGLEAPKPSEAQRYGKRGIIRRECA